MLGFAEIAVGRVLGLLRGWRTGRVGMAAPPLPVLVRIRLLLWLSASAPLAFLRNEDSAIFVAGRSTSSTATRDVILDWVPAAASGSALAAVPPMVTWDVTGSIFWSLVLARRLCALRFYSSVAGRPDVAFPRSTSRRENLMHLTRVQWVTVK